MAFQEVSDVKPVAANPAAQAPDSEKKKCAKCGKVDEAIKNCSRCLQVGYCGPECQKLDWPSHKQVCVKKPSGEEKGESVVDRIAAQFKQQFSQWKPDPGGKEMWLNFARQTKPNLDEFFYHSYMAHCTGMKGKKTALDLGCGTRSNSLFLLSEGWTVTAVDFSGDVLKMVKKQSHQINPYYLIDNQLLLKEMDINDYDFPEKHRLILALDVLPYTNPNKISDLLKKMHAALEGDGILMGTIHVAPHHHAYMKAKGIWIFDNQKTVKDFLTGLDFKIVKFDCSERKDYSSCRFVVQKAK